MTFAHAVHNVNRLFAARETFHAPEPQETADPNTIRGRLKNGCQKHAIQTPQKHPETQQNQHT